MLNERIRRIFGIGRFSSFLLEILAIFFGITASFVVDEWRESRQDQQIFERYLEAIYFEAASERSLITRSLYQCYQSVAALNMLLGDDVDSVSDEDLVELLGMVFTPWSRVRGDSSYQALLAADLAMPLDDTMQQLSDSYATRELYAGLLERNHSDHNDVLARSLSQWGAMVNPQISYWDEAGQSLVLGPRLDHPMNAGIRKLFEAGGNLQLTGATPDTTRHFLQDPDTRQLLTQELNRLIASGDFNLAIIGADANIQKIVRERLPNVTVPVRTLGLLGSATEARWLVPRAIPLSAERKGGDWWSAEMTLADGMAKFIANQNYSTSWGAPYAWDAIDPLADPDPTHYQGDPDAVFPSGIGELDGQNIPIRAGRYRVRFNIRSFEYRFEAITEGKM